MVMRRVQDNVAVRARAKIKVFVHVWHHARGSEIPATNSIST